MLVRAYLPKFLTALFGGLFIALGIFSFGHAIIFDRIFLAVLIFTAIICRHDINVISIVVILFLLALLDELAWLVIDSYEIHNVILSIFAFATAYYCKHDKITRFAFVILILTTCANVYWYIISYPPPQISWYLWLLLSSIGLRYLIFARLSYVEKIKPTASQSINLDWIAYKLSGLIIFTQGAMIIEYLIRHIFSLSDALLVYTVYPYIIQTLATILIWVVFNESYKLLASKFMKA